MPDLPSSWPEMLGWGNLLVAKAKATQPLILGVLAVPCILALALRSFVALLLTLLIAASALAAFQVQTEQSHQWLITAMTGLAGLLAVIQAAKLRRLQRYAQEAETRMNEAQGQLGEANERLQREVYWRKAAEGRTTQQPLEP